MAEQRKLATIMSVDVAGYSRASEKDDTAMAAAVGRLRGVIQDAIAPHSGRIFNTAGDGFMIEFTSAISGVAAAQALLTAIEDQGLPKVRIGLHLGDVILSANDDLLGHGVNVAARLMALAAPGTAVMSAPVQVQLNEMTRVTLRPLGRVQLDKMGTRIDAFAIATKEARFAHIHWRRARPALVAVAAIALLAVLGLAVAEFAGVFSTPPTAPVAAATPRIAVLRFENLGTTEPYFAEGVADELITELSRLSGLDVVARASSFSLTGDHATPAEAAGKLHATLVLTGSVRRLPNAVRVNAELVEAPGGRNIWSQAFERPADEAFALQRDIAVRVAQVADVRITEPAPKKVDAEAYRLYLQGRQLQLSRAVEDWTQVRDIYQSAVARDPTFAEAWAVLSRAEANVATNKVDSGPANGYITPALMAPTLAAADRAIALDRSLAEPFLVKAMSYTWLGNWQEAAKNAAEAEKRGGLAGNFYRALGYFQLAVNARRQSTSRDPLSATEWNNLAYTCEYVGNARCQLEAAQRAHELAPEDQSALKGMERALVASNRPEDAWDLIKQIDPKLRNPSTNQLIWMAGHGPRVPNTEIFKEVAEGATYVDVATGMLADAQQWDAAARMLDQWGPSARSTLFSVMRLQWAPLRKAPQFWKLMEREGLVKYWHDSKHWPDFCNSEPVCEKYR